MRYRGIDIVYIGVKLLYKHNGTSQRYLTKRFPASSLIDTGERSVGKVRQNDMALRMNATFLKVLKEVLLGLPITKPNVKRGCKKVRRRPGTKRVSSRSKFVLRCHVQSIQEREREGEHITTRTKRKKRKYTNAWTCDVLKINCIMGKTQSKPTSTHQQ